MEKKNNERSVSAFNNELKLKGFNAFQIEDDANGVRNYSRKDFYKICLTTGESIINYADRSYVMKGTISVFRQSECSLFVGDNFKNLCWLYLSFF